MSVPFDSFMKAIEGPAFHVLAAQVRKDGEVIDDWSRFPSKPRFESFSTAKTFTAVGVGIAIDEGLLTLDEPVIDSFPEESFDVTSPNARAITVRDLLTMTSGLSQSILWRDGYDRAHEKDWIRYFYTAGKFDHTPGTQFKYNNANTYMLSCLVERKAGKNLHEYLRYRLFEPLEIHNPDWTICPKGHTVAANGMSINSDEMGRFGQMLANGGVYDGKRIVSEAFLKDMMTAHTPVTGGYIPGDPPVDAGYGYQIWIDPQNRGVFLWGNYGQYCVVIPEKNLVVTVLSLQEDDGGANNTSLYSPLRQKIWEHLVTQF